MENTIKEYKVEFVNATVAEVTYVNQVLQTMEASNSDAIKSRMTQMKLAVNSSTNEVTRYRELLKYVSNTSYNLELIKETKSEIERIEKSIKRVTEEIEKGELMVSEFATFKNNICKELYTEHSDEETLTVTYTYNREKLDFFLSFVTWIYMIQEEKEDKVNE